MPLLDAVWRRVASPEQSSAERIDYDLSSRYSMVPDKCIEPPNESCAGGSDKTHPMAQPVAAMYAFAGCDNYMLNGPWFVKTNGDDKDENRRDHNTNPEDENSNREDETSHNRLQVIVKLANIHLTPDNPTYDGGSWHLDGQLNERIVATVLYYYDCENVTDSHRSFCAMSDVQDMILEHDQADFVNNLFATEDRDCEYNFSLVLQKHGSVLTRDGRLLAFPNVFQQKVASFSLADKTKPGHRKIVAFFLVDPATPILSTANIPRLQQAWAPRLLAIKLPRELCEMVDTYLDCPYSLREERRYAKNSSMRERPST